MSNTRPNRVFAPVRKNQWGYETIFPQECGSTYQEAVNNGNRNDADPATEWARRNPVIRIAILIEPDEEEPDF